MPVQNVSNLGRALTRLGLEDRFLSNGELSNFPLVERGAIANGIIAEKLRLGRWQSVVNMMYGGFGKADALYEGDRIELRESILNSAREHSDTDYARREAVEVLAKAGEADLLLRLATVLPDLKYQDFSDMTGRIKSSFFNDPEFGPQRAQILHQTAANKAFSEKKYESAFLHFSEEKDNDGIGRVFDSVLSHEGGSYSEDLLEKIALSDTEQKDERVKRVVLSSLPDEAKTIKPLTALLLSEKYSVPLSPDEASALHSKVAETVRAYELEKLSTHPQVKLLWAQRHVSDEPKPAYDIFKRQGFEGPEVVLAVQNGLGMERYQNEGRALSVSEVSEEHLRRTYDGAVFDTQIKIATRLKDQDKLQSLSREAHGKKDLSQAYWLWVRGGGKLDDDYINGVRSALIAKSITDHSGHMSFLDKSDTKGMDEAYDALMKTRKGERSNNVRGAYDIALELEDEDRAQRAREAMMKINPEWAVNIFTSIHRSDVKGLDYALGVVASEHGVGKEELMNIVKKYRAAWD